MKRLLVAAALGLLLAAVPSARADDAAAAQSLLKKSHCMKCHSVDKKKDGPPYKEVALEYRDDPEAEQKLFLHVTSKPTIEVDGVEEEHPAIKSKDEGQIRNAVRWILSR